LGGLPVVVALLALRVCEGEGDMAQE
jgi:hypothetical protein